MFCEEGLKFGAASPQGARVRRRPGRARGGGRPVQGQERRGARHRGAGRSRRRVAAGRGRRRQGGATSRRRTSSSSAASRWARCRVPRREATIIADLPAGDEAGAGRRHRARACGCAPMPSTATRPSARKARSRRGGAGRRSRSPASPPVQKAYAVARRGRGRRACWRATSSTSRPTCSIRRSSPAAPARSKKLGVAVEVLDVAAMKKLGMNALLGVGQGSEHDSRCVIMRWNGGKTRRRRRSPSSARACASTPAASRSSRPPAWRT